MRSSNVPLASVLLIILVALPRMSHAQYMYLDSNGDGVSTTTDRMNGISTPTVVNVYVNTSSNRDSSSALCDAGGSSLTINSYVFCLRASGGEVAFSNFVNRQAGMPSAFGEFNPGNGNYKNGQGGSVANAPGVYLLATLTITAISGNPRIDIVSQVPGSPDLTSFGSQCTGLNGDNTYSLSVDWFDVGGLGPINNPPEVSAPDSVYASAGQEVSVSAQAVDPEGQDVTISVTGAPTFLTFSGGGPSSGSASASLVGSPTAGDVGTYNVTWNAVDNGAPARSSSFVTILTVLESGNAPAISAPDVASGSASNPISFQVVANGPGGEAVDEMTATGIPTGAAFAPGQNGTATFRWSPDAEVGTHDVTFTARIGNQTSEKVTHLSVSPPTGPIRPRISASLLNLREGDAWSEQIIDRTEGGRAYVNLFLEGDPDTESLSQLGVTVGARVGHMATVRCPLENLGQLFDTPNIWCLRAPGVCHTLTDSSALDTRVAGLRSWPSFQRPLTGQTGNTEDSVVVGIVDTGIDVRNPDFLRVNENTRLISYWDMARYGPGREPLDTGYTFGTEWKPDTLSQAGFTSSRDTEGHGTYVAGIAAGNGQAEQAAGCLDSGSYQWVGMAPEAALCVVKHPTPVLDTQIAEGVDYIFKRSASRPAVVNLSLGEHIGPHDGRAFFDQFIDSLVLVAQAVPPTFPARVVVAAAGNDGNTGIHARAVQLHPAGLIVLNVAGYNNQFSGSQYIKLEGWFDENDSIAVSVISPHDSSGYYSVEPAVYSPSDFHSGHTEVTTTANTNDGYITVSFATGNEPPPGWGNGGSWSPDHVLNVRIQDNTVNGKKIAAGEWRIVIEGRSTPSGRPVDMYLTSWDLAPIVPVGAVQFNLNEEDRSYTIASPASASMVVAVGAYETRTCWMTGDDRTPACSYPADAMGDVCNFSSRGPLRNGITKPDLCAPGGPVISTKSAAASFDPQYVAPGGKYVTNWGTSAAAPHVTGVVALLLAQANWRQARVTQVLGRLRSSARRDIFTGPTSNDIWGWGKLDARAALAPVRWVQVVKPRKGTVFMNKWAEGSFFVGGVWNSAPGGERDSFDTVVAYLAADGCTPLPPVATFTNVHANTTTNFLYEVPNGIDTTATARMIVTASYPDPTSPIGGVATIGARSDGVFSLAIATASSVESAETPARLVLHRNEPNPFNPSTKIAFEIPEHVFVKLRIFNANGRAVRTLVDRTMLPGTYSVIWDGDTDRGHPAASGVYFCELVAGPKRLTHKLTLLK